MGLGRGDWCGELCPGLSGGQGNEFPYCRQRRDLADADKSGRLSSSGGLTAKSMARPALRVRPWGALRKNSFVQRKKRIPNHPRVMDWGRLPR